MTAGSNQSPLIAVCEWIRVPKWLAAVNLLSNSFDDSPESCKWILCHAENTRFFAASFTVKRLVSAEIEAHYHRTKCGD
jgi:hypothetical protein